MDKYILRRIEKWWKTKIIAWSYRDLPFEISWTEGKYHNPYDIYPYPDDIISWFWVGDRLYVILKRK